MWIPQPLPAFDPTSVLQQAQRPLAGVIFARAVTFDVTFEQVSRWILVQDEGALSYVGLDGVTVVLPSLVPGVFHPIFAIKINSSGTSVTSAVWGN